MAITYCYTHLVVKNGNFILLLASSGQELLLTSSGQEWQFQFLLTSRGQEWLFHIATDT